MSSTLGTHRSVGLFADILAHSRAGNEMNSQGMRPAPSQWTLIIAKHLKSRAPKTLVMDGSFARNDDPERCYPKEVLESPDVDIVSSISLVLSLSPSTLLTLSHFTCRSLTTTMEVETSGESRRIAKSRKGTTRFSLLENMVSSIPRRITRASYLRLIQLEVRLERKSLFYEIWN